MPHDMLKRGSWAPTRVRSFYDQLIASSQNAYVTELDLNPSLLQVVDTLRDVVLGYGRDIILRILRILQVLGGGSVQTFDARSALNK